MKLLLIDIETTGLQQTSQICEVCCCLYNITENNNEKGIVSILSILLPIEKNEAFNINKIHPELTNTSNTKQLLSQISSMIDECDYLVAFNASFDAPRFNKLMGIKNKNWLCAMRDFSWGCTDKKSFKLIELALWLDIGVSCAHRAFDDVRLLAECLNRHKDSYNMLLTAIREQKTEKVTIKANTKYAQNDLVKSFGFVWDGDIKGWCKQVHSDKVDEFTKTLPFKFEILQ